VISLDYSDICPLFILILFIHLILLFIYFIVLLYLDAWTLSSWLLCLGSVWIMVHGSGLLGSYGLGFITADLGLCCILLIIHYTFDI